MYFIEWPADSCNTPLAKRPAGRCSTVPDLNQPVVVWPFKSAFCQGRQLVKQWHLMGSALREKHCQDPSSVFLSSSSGPLGLPTILFLSSSSGLPWIPFTFLCFVFVSLSLIVCFSNLWMTFMYCCSVDTPILLLISHSLF
jgi:hypothetical protein